MLQDLFRHGVRIGFFESFFIQIGRAPAVSQGFIDSAFDGISRCIRVEGVAEQHRCREDGGTGIGDALARNVRGGAVDRLVEARHLADGSGRHHANGAAQDGCFIAQDIPKEVARDDDVELFGIQGKLHGTVVHVEMVQGDIRIAFCQFRDRAAPEPGGGQHIGFIHGGHFVAAFAGGFHGKAADPLDFGDTVVFQIPGAFHAIMDFRFTAVAKVDAADEFTDDHDVRTGDDIGLQRRIFRQDGGYFDRAQVDIEPQIFAQAQDSLFRAFGRFHIVPFVAAHGTEQDRVGCFGRIDRILRQRGTAEIIGCTACRSVFIRKIQMVDAIDFFQDFDSGGRDFLADAVAGDDRDFFAHALRSFT